MDLRYTLCNDNDSDIIIDNLVKYNLSQVKPCQNKNFINFNYKICNENGNIIAGVLAKMYCWNIMYIDVLWVDANYRRQRIGSQLLNFVEQKAKEQGCYLVHLDTFDFQARDFYIEKGYDLFGVLEECPKGHCRYYLKKRLE